MALPHDTMSWSAVCDCGIPDHTHLLFFVGLVIYFLMTLSGLTAITLIKSEKELAT